MKTIKNKIFEALGTASMCWSETPKGIFDSNEAVKIGDNLHKEVESIAEDVAIQFSQWLSNNLYKETTLDRWYSVNDINGTMFSLKQLFTEFKNNHYGK